MFFDRLKTLCADHVLDTAGIVDSGLGIDSETLKPGGEQGMPFIDPVCDLPSGLCQRDISFRRYDDMMAFSQLFHRYTDA